MTSLFVTLFAMKYLQYCGLPSRFILVCTQGVKSNLIWKPPLQKWLSTTSDDYQYLQKSKVPMMHFQPSLPRLPIPALEKTCQRYLNAQKPLLSTEKFKETAEIVRQFQEKEGKELNKELVAIDKKNKRTSYISKPWFDMYLKAREPIVINVNPFMGFNDDPQASYNDQLIRASNLLISSLRFLRSLRSNLLEPEIYHLNPAKSDTEIFRKIVRIIPSQFSWYGAYLFKAFPLDMSQYQSLFNGTRIPKTGQDELFNDPSSTHMLVLRNGNFYVFDVLDKNGYIKDPAYLHGCLNQILTDSRSKAEFPVAALTTLDRNSWANLRQQLVNGGNADTLRLIDTAIFSLSLDDVSVNHDLYALSRTMLHGDGTNRWFDKSLQVALTKDGKAAINYEHSWGDGVANVRYMNEVFKDSTEKHFIHPGSEPANPEGAVRCLEFKLSPQVKRGITEALEKLNSTIKSLHFNLMQYEKFGKSFIKSVKLSPDSVLQLSFQMAYFKQNGKFAATYESCSTAAFKHGRTETVRPATVQTQKCVEAFLKKDAHSVSVLRSLLEDCSTVHGNLTKEATMGNGFDRHLFALRGLAEAKNPNNVPKIFQDAAYTSINHNIMSTSTLTSSSLLLGAFGPVVSDGFGIGYRVLDDKLAAFITSYPPAQDAPGFVECIQSSLDDIHDVLLKSEKVRERTTHAPQK